MLNTYLESLKTTQSRNPSEHAYRSSLNHIFLGLSMVNEPSNKGRNKIDMEVYTKDGLVSFYVETKMLGFDLATKQHQKQFNRYKTNFQKLLITNFLDFEFYKNGQLVDKCSLANKEDLVANESGYEKFKLLLDSFTIDCIQFSNPILLAKKLAEKTKLLKNQILSNIDLDEKELKETRQNGTPITKQYKLLAYRDEFKKILLTDVDNTSFSNLYAQTITYGLFASRYYAYQQNSNTTFNRNHAYDFIPKTNPLLKQLFESISIDSKSSSFDKKINSIIDDITTILANTNMNKIILSLKSSNDDIVIHFYESFLEQYDPELRKRMGVWYTPIEIVDYIVRGVDEILKKKFNIKDGISSSDKQSYTYNKRTKSNKGSFRQEKIVRDNVHKVQILDPATGTGNFLNSIVSYIKSNFKYPTFWNDYVNKDLIPRINGFELMMPSYVIAHMKMYEILKDSLSSDVGRFNIYLTNTLNGVVDIEDDLLSISDLVYQLNEEAIGANRIRQEQPVMIVLGNPPYNSSSKNHNDFIEGLMLDYNYGDYTVNDDYAKFIRYAQNLIDQNGSGIVAYVTSNSFLDCKSMSGMRKSLLNSFDEIYIFNLYGRPIDDNVFALVQQQVSISFFVKTTQNDKNKFAKVFYNELKGKRKDKFDYCRNESIYNGDFKEIKLIEPEYFFYPQDENLKENYESDSFSLGEIFVEISKRGIMTSCDSLVIDPSLINLKEKMIDFTKNGILPKSIKSIEKVRNRGKNVKRLSDGNFTSILYRPFDKQHYFESELTDTPSLTIRKHERAKNQVFLNFSSSNRGQTQYSLILCTQKVVRHNFFLGIYNEVIAPLFQYEESNIFMGDSNKTNFKKKFLDDFGATISKSHQDDSNLANDQTFSSLDVMDYIYGVLNDRMYTRKYNQLLKSNYPRVPYPKSMDEFISYRNKGSKLRIVHLDDETQDVQATYNANNNKIEKVFFADNKVYFNSDSYFDHITQEMWDLKIGSVQPLKNWLETRLESNGLFDRAMVDIYLNVIYKVRNSI